MSTDTDTDAGDEERELPPPEKQPGDGYRATKSPCHREDCEGRLWYKDHDLVCDTCYQRVDMDRQRRSVSLENPWAHYWSNRPRYRQSNKVKLPGGFVSAYDWAESDEVEGTVVDLDPTEFYGY